jgi:hypothetical protein
MTNDDGPKDEILIALEKLDKETLEIREDKRVAILKDEKMRPPKIKMSKAEIIRQKALEIREREKDQLIIKGIKWFLALFAGIVLLIKFINFEIPV